MDNAALHLAASAGHVDVKYLIEQGAQVDVKNEVRIDVYTIPHMRRLGLSVVIPLYSSFYKIVDGIIG